MSPPQRKSLKQLNTAIGKVQRKSREWRPNVAVLLLHFWLRSGVAEWEWWGEMEREQGNNGQAPLAGCCGYLWLVPLERCSFEYRTPVALSPMLDVHGNENPSRGGRGSKRTSKEGSGRERVKYRICIGPLPLWLFEFQSVERFSPLFYRFSR